MGSPRVLVVEDERVINDAVAERLRSEGFEVAQAYDGPGAVDTYAATHPDLVVLDVMLPGFDGLEVCRRIQAQSVSQSTSRPPVPVLMLTARDDEADILVGLAVGADDYLTKPFRMRELVARVRALLRRVDRAAVLASRPAARLVVGDLVVDTGTRRVAAAGEEVHLTPTEFDLLTRLAASPGEVLSRERLLADVWDWEDASGTRTVDSHVKALRAKIGADRVRTVHGVGYALEAGGKPMSSPLASVGSIKVKLGLLVVASVMVAMLVSLVGSDSGVPLLLAVPVTLALALGVTQLLAVGMTSPLREMTEAARRMARGDYRGRVHAETTDEVGELARAFNQMAAELDTVDREQRALVATVSHELRTPLAGLTAVLENLADGVVPADEEHLEAAVGQARRLSDLVGDLLELSRVDAGVAPLRLVDVDVADLLDETVAELVRTGRAVSFAVDVADALHVRADRARLRQLVVNLLDNAVRHGPERGTVRVTATRHGERWRLAIADEGPGVPAADRDRAFERFGTLAADPSSSAAGGTGLGLAIARWVATLHGGTVRFVDPPPGTTGAVLSVDLPLDPPPRTPARPAAVLESAPDPPEAQMSDADPPVAVATAAAATPVVTQPLTDPVFSRHWPDAVESGRPVVVAAVCVGFLAGLLLPERDMGLAFFLVLGCAGLTVWWWARYRRDRFTLTCAVLAGLCTLPLILLAAEWIAVMCVLAGAACLIAGVTRGSRLLEFLAAGFAWPLSGIRGLPWLGRSLRGVLGTGRAPRIVVTVAWSALVLLVFGLLFVSADAVVAGWVDDVLPDLTAESFVLRCFVGAFVGGATLAAAYLAVNPPDLGAVPGATAAATAHRFEWLVPVLIVDAVFAVFVAAQATVLFGGHDYVQRTTGLTYAEYVHQGFGQLTLATMLMLVVVWGASQRVGPEPPDRLWMRISLGLLCALTLVVVVSALHRMQLYQEAYGFTRERLLADVFQGWLGVVVIAVAVAGVAPWRRWVPRFALVTGTLGLLGIAAINPDAWIAEHNVDRYEATGKLDWQYLATLSADAVPSVQRLPVDVQHCVFSYSAGQAFDDDWLEWNLGRERAREAFGGDLPDLTEPVTCPADLDTR